MGELSIRSERLLTSTESQRMLSSQPLLDNDEDTEQNMQADHVDSIFPIAIPNENAEKSENVVNEEDVGEIGECIPITGPPNNINHTSRRKSNIYLASLRLSQKSLSVRSALYSPKSCPVCLDEYKVGDEIAWSKNE